MVLAWFPLAMVVLAASIAASRHFLHGPFDWRYQTISALSSPARNPDGSAYLSLGIAVCFAMMLPVGQYMHLRVEPGRLSRFAFKAVRFGCVMAVAVGLERAFCPDLWLPSTKGHELLAVAAFLSSSLGLAGFWLAHARQWGRNRQVSGWVTALLALLSAAPFVGAGLSQLWLYLVPNDLGWVGAHWARRGVPAYLSMSFWEWLTLAVGFSYGYLLLHLLPARPHPVRDDDDGVGAGGRRQVPSCC